MGLGRPLMPNLDKVGNLIIYLVDAIDSKYRQQLYVTKLLKLLYIIDETAVTETGVPITGLDYGVWKMGPVAKDVYIDLVKDNSRQLSYFAEAKKQDLRNDREGAQVLSVNSFDDSEFSDYELNLIDRVIDEHGYKSPELLITRLHGEDTLWYDIVKSNDLEKIFEEKYTSSFFIDFSRLIENDPQKLELFRNAQESLKL